MQYISEGTEIILWGTGFVGRRIMQGKYGNYKISFAINGKLGPNETYKIGDLTVYSPSVLEDKSLFKNQPIVIGVDRWQEMAARLEKMGKHIFLDYIPYSYLYGLDIDLLRACKDDNERREQIKKLSFGKKLCGLYGFCHMSVYHRLLSENRQFTDEYCLLNLPQANGPDLPNFDLLPMPWLYSSLDLLILGFSFQSKTFGVPDWRTVKSMVNDKCKVILVTNAAFKGYFPQHTEEVPVEMQRLPATVDRIRYRIRWGDKNINRMIRAGKTSDTILRTISATDFYDAEKVNRFYEKSLKKLEDNEAECDIRIGDYIRKYGRQKRLMYSSTHPVDCVMKEIAIRLFRKIGLDTEPMEVMPEDDMPSLSSGAEFIYPSVSRALGIAEEQEFEKIRVSLDERYLTLSEYIDFYMEANKPYLMSTM